MADEKIYLTEQGKKEKEDRLAELVNVLRPAVIERIKFAKEQGDLSENAEYSAARDEQGKIEGEILELEETLKRAVIIQKGEKGKISMGSVVKIYDLEMEEEAEYKIVGTTEANIKEGKISNESLLGQVLLGAKKGDVLTVPAQNGAYQVKVLEIVSDD